uniref:Uncharacterized protein n=1 Tax=Melopsittacus undulatus TaxID=13146 RepID=A0A8C6J337_MELUD
AGVGDNLCLDDCSFCLQFTYYHIILQEQVRAGEMAKFGRDSNICHYNFMDARVSRIQFSLQLYRKLKG